VFAPDEIDLGKNVVEAAIRAGVETGSPLESAPSI
jgi:hypothetical protein